MAHRGDEPTSQSAKLTVDYAIAHILAESRTSDEALENILAVIATTLGWDIGVIWEPEQDVELLHCVQAWCAPNVDVQGFADSSRRVRFAPGVGLPGRVWATGEPAWIEDLSRDENFPRAQAATAVGLRSAFGFPIRSGSRILGVIEFFTRETRKPEADLLNLVSVLGGQIGQFMVRRHTEEEVRRSEALKTAMLESALDAVIAIDYSGNILEFNPAAEKIFGYRRADAIGREMAALIIPPALRDRHRRGLERFLAGGEGTLLGKRLELTGMRADSSEFPAEVTIARIGSDDPPMFIGYVRDISERKEDEQALQFIASASATLDKSLELDAILEALAKLTVPYLGDGCQVDVLEPDGSIRRAAAATADPSLQPVVDELRRHQIDPDGPHPIARAARTGEMQVVPDVTEPFRREIAETDAYHQALRKWPAKSVLVVPLKSRGKVLGTVSLASFSRDRTYGGREISLIEELARRAAIAVENARAFEERSQVAGVLKRSLLPPRLPEVPGAEVAARFQPAAGTAEVGGDFYDVFEAGEAGWAIAIGDVSGRGAEAAAVTALARHTLRAAAVAEKQPARILAVLNEALLSQLEDVNFCTATLGLLKIGEGEAKLVLASAGHPLPLLLRANGQVATIGSSGTLLGVIPDPEFQEEEVGLSTGDVLVFYTDGVAAVQEQKAGFGPDELAAVVAGCVDLDAAATANCIEQAVLESRRKEEAHDDAAILVARILGGELAQSGGVTVGAAKD